MSGVSKWKAASSSHYGDVPENGSDSNVLDFMSAFWKLIS